MVLVFTRFPVILAENLVYLYFVIGYSSPVINSSVIMKFYFCLIKNGSMLIKFSSHFCIHLG